MTNSGDDFILKSNEAFAERRKNIFDQLTTIERNLNDSSTLKQTEQMETDDDNGTTINKSLSSNNRKPSRKSLVTKHYRGKESIFKSPDDRITKEFIRRMPDFKKNPHKWTKYTLSDVKDDDISDRSNTRAAMSFLNELKQRKEIDQHDSNDDDDDGTKKIIFKKRNVNENTGSNQDKVEDNGKVDNRGSFRNSKVVMPEYVVGQKVEKNKRNRNMRNTNSKGSNSSCQQLKLNHLYEEDE